MNAKRVFSKWVLVSALVCVAGVAVHSYLSNSRNRRVNCVTNLKQIGLGFRLNRNDCRAPFILTGNAVTSNRRQQP